MPKHILYGAVSLVVFFSQTCFATDNGLITVESKNSVPVTIQQFEDAIRADGDQGWMIFTQLDHSAAAEKHGQKLLPRTVIVYGNPKLGTANMVTAPALAIDIPPKVLVWQDEQGKVWFTYNSAVYLHRTVYPRHSVAPPPPQFTESYGKLLEKWAARATQ
jgi:uncharacterized protein (DUF302 family)